MRLYDFASEFKAIYSLCDDIEVNQETGEIIDNSDLNKIEIEVD